MNSILRKVTVVFLVVFALYATGCLSSGTSPEQNNGQDEVVDNNNGGDTTPDDQNNDNTGGTDTPDLVIVQNDNTKPMITYFGTEDLDDTVVEPGQVVTFQSSGYDTDGEVISTRLEATGGIIDGNKWTAPNKGGIYQIKAISNDGKTDSDPAIISLKVPNPNGGLDIVGISASKKSTENSAPRKAIAATDLLTISDDKVLLEVGKEEATILVSYTTDAGENTNVSFEYSRNTETGRVSLDTWDPAANPNHVYTYTPPSSVTKGNETITITFRIFDSADITNTVEGSVTFILNNAPVINGVELDGDSVNSMEPNTSKTLTVDAGDIDEDSLTYHYEIYSGSNIASIDENSTTNTAQLDSTEEEGEVEVLVVVTDARGSSDQYLFTVTVAPPVLLALADDSAADYAGATDDLGEVVTEFDITLDKDNSGYTTIFATDYDTEPAQQNGFEIFYDDTPAGALITPTWTDTVQINGADVEILAAQVFSTTALGSSDENPEWYASYAGTHTIDVELDVDGVTYNTSDTVSVNTPAEITNISYVDASGATVTVFDGTTVLTGSDAPDLAPEQVLTFAVSIYDEENENNIDAASIDEDDIGTSRNDGFFEDHASKFLVGVLDDAPTAAGVTFADSQTNIGEITDEDGTVGYQNDDDLSTSIAFNYNVDVDASAGPGEKQYLIFRAKDGLDNLANGSNGSYTITDAIGATTVLPDDEGIAKALDAENTGVDTAAEAQQILIGYDARYTAEAGEFVLEYDDDVAPNGWFLRKADGTSLTDAGGSPIKLGASGDAVLANDDGIANHEWLLINIDPALVPADGDKVYFKTYRIQVVIEFEMVEGPRVSTTEAPKYVTLGDPIPTKLQVYAYNDGAPATVTWSLRDADTGELVSPEDLGYSDNYQIDSDSDGIANEVYYYQAPSVNYTGTQTVNIDITITDNTDPSKVNNATITIYLNHAPEIRGFTTDATQVDDSLDELWAKAGIHGIEVGATVYDEDSDDTFNYEWDLAELASGTLLFPYSSSIFWEPFNGPTPLGAVGKQILLTITDQDENGIPKTGIAQSAVVINLNEDPTVSSVDISANTSPSWQAAGDVVNNTVPTTSTLDFNTATGQWPEVRVNVEPQGVSDASDDKNSLNYSYYLTKTSPAGAAAINENVSEVFRVSGATVPTTGAYWKVSNEARTNGGLYYINTVISDDKPGVAKGMTKYSKPVEVVKDSTITDFAPTTANMTVLKNEAATAANETFIAGDEVKLVVPNSTIDANFRDLNSVSVNIDEFIFGHNEDATTETTMLEGETFVTLDRTNVDSDYTDDEFEVSHMISAASSYVDTSGNNLYANWVADVATDIVYTAVGTTISDANTTAALVPEWVRQGDIIVIESNNHKYHFEVTDFADTDTINVTDLDGLATNLTQAEITDMYVVRGADTGIGVAGVGDVTFKAVTITDIAGNTDANMANNDFGAYNLDNDPPVLEGVALAIDQTAVTTSKQANDDDTENGNTSLPDNDKIFNIGDQITFDAHVGEGFVDASGAERAATNGKIDLSDLFGTTHSESNWSTLTATDTDAYETFIARYIIDGAGVNALDEIGVEYDAADSEMTVDAYLEDNAGNRTYGKADILGTRIEIDSVGDDIADGNPGVADANAANLYTFATTANAQYVEVGDYLVVTVDPAGAGIKTGAIEEHILYVDAVDYTAGTAHFDETDLASTGDVNAAAHAAGDVMSTVIVKSNTFFQGVDLRRPKVVPLDTEIYSYDPTAVEGESGYLPLISDTGAAGNRTTFINAVAETNGTLGIDYTAAGVANVGDTITIEFVAGTLYDVVAGDTLVLFDTANTLTVEALADITATDTQLDVKLLELSDLSNNGGALTITASDEKKFQYIDDVVLGAVDDVTTDPTTAEVLKIEFDELLYVGYDLAAATYPNLAEPRISDVDNLLGTTVNDYSITVSSLSVGPSGQIVKTDVSTGANQVVSAGADTLDMTRLANFAYVPDYTNGTSTVYIVLLAAGADTVDHIATNTNFEVLFNDYSTDTFTGAGADMFKVICDAAGNAIDGSANSFTEGNNPIGF